MKKMLLILISLVLVGCGEDRIHPTCQFESNIEVPSDSLIEASEKGWVLAGHSQSVSKNVPPIQVTITKSNEKTDPTQFTTSKGKREAAPGSYTKVVKIFKNLDCIMDAKAVDPRNGKLLFGHTFQTKKSYYVDKRQKGNSSYSYGFGYETWDTYEPIYDENACDDFFASNMDQIVENLGNCEIGDDGVEWIPDAEFGFDG